MNMKNKSSLALMLSSSIFVMSCNKNEDLPKPNDDIVNVKVELKGVDVTETMIPMTRAGETVTYFLAVKQDNNPYAWYCMDSFEDVSLSLLKNHSYSITGYVAYDMKGSLYWTGTVGGGVIYLGYDKTNGFVYTDSRKYSIDTPIKTYDYKMLVCSEEFSTIPETITLNMYAAYFGLKIKATNLDDTLEIALGAENGGSYSYDYTAMLTKEHSSTECILHFLKPLDVVGYAEQGSEFSKQVNLTVKKIDSNNNTSVLHSDNITVSRLKYTILELKMKDDGNNTKSCALSLEDGDIVDGNTINLEL